MNLTICQYAKSNPRVGLKLDIAILFLSALKLSTLVPSFLSHPFPFPLILPSPPFTSHPFPFLVPARGSEERCKLPSKQVWMEPGQQIVSRALWVKDHILVTVCHLTLVRLRYCPVWATTDARDTAHREFWLWGNCLIFSASMSNHRRKQCRQLARPSNFY